MRQIHVFVADMFWLCLWLALLAIIFVPLERLLALHSRKIFREGLCTDLGYFFLNGLAPALLLSPLLGLVAWAVRSFVPQGLHQFVAEAPFWSRVVAALVVGDIGYYWGHRCMHAVPVLWRFHAVHHSANEIDFLVNTRAHPFDIVFGRLCGIVPLYILGLAGPAGTGGTGLPVLVIVIGTVWGFFIHSNLRWRFGPLAGVVSTPAFHHWHHAVIPADRNFASLLPVVDRVFRTYHAPPRLWPARYGINDPMPPSLSDQLLHPFICPRPSVAVQRNGQRPAAAVGDPPHGIPLSHE